MAAHAEHRLECNPIREFLDEHMVVTPPDTSLPLVAVEHVIQRYKRWAVTFGRNDKFGGPTIGKEIRRAFPTVTRAQARQPGGTRIWHYVGISWLDDVEKAAVLAQVTERVANKPPSPPTKARRPSKDALARASQLDELLREFDANADEGE